MNSPTNAPDGPRIAPLPRDQWTDEVRESIAVLKPANARHTVERRPGGPKALNALGTIVRHPELARAFHTFNGHILYTSTLTARQRELLVLRLAVIRDATYEWRQHVFLAEDAGLDAEEIQRVTEGPDAPGWSALDAALLRAVDELIGDAMVTDATWVVLTEFFDDHQFMDLVFTVGAYDILAMAFRSFRIELDDDLLPR